MPFCCVTSFPTAQHFVVYGKAHNYLDTARLAGLGNPASVGGVFWTVSQSVHVPSNFTIKREDPTQYLRQKKLNK